MTKAAKAQLEMEKHVVWTDLKLPIVLDRCIITAFLDPKLLRNHVLSYQISRSEWIYCSFRMCIMYKAIGSARTLISALRRFNIHVTMEMRGIYFRSGLSMPIHPR